MSSSEHMRYNTRIKDYEQEEELNVLIGIKGLYIFSEVLIMNLLLE